MKTDTSHIPEGKQKELCSVVDTILQFLEPKMIILYGSYARGDYVDIPMEYESDFDILVICGQKQTKNHKKQNEITKDIQGNDEIPTMVHIQYETLSTVNGEIAKYNYLFIDIRKEGIVLYDSNEGELVEVKELEPKEKYEKAIRDYDYWLKSSTGFDKGFKFFVQDGNNKLAAFHLHQKTEHLFMALFLVYSGYKPKTHNLDDFILHTNKISSDIADHFPNDSDQDKHLYDLLKRAYVDARYDMNYTITETELQTLEGWVAKFEKLVEQLCKKKLLELEKEAQK